MSALAHYIERAGIPTVVISLVREHSERIRPPRTLWTPFELGRPLGAPGDAAFQRRVLLAALETLAETAGPVLADFADDAPSGVDGGGGEGPWACPVRFPKPEAQASDPESLQAQVEREVQSLAPWHERARERRGGRTTAGLSGLAPAAIVSFLAGYAERGEETSPGDGVAFSRYLKHALDDLLAWYQEAATAQPGPTPSGRELTAWFWGETKASRLFLAVRERGSESEDPAIRFVVKALLVPRGASAWLAAAP